MRKLLSLLFVAMLAVQAWGQTFTIDNLIYSVNGANKVYVVSGKPELSGAITIPSLVTRPETETQYTVTNIREGTFKNNTNLTSVHISGAIKIGKSAFSGCTGLTSVTIDEGAGSVGEEAFKNCNSLSSVTIGDGVTSIGNSAFDNCSSLTTITIGDGVSSIGDAVFYNCSSLTSITIPNSVTKIGLGAFSGCSSLESITLPFVGRVPHVPTDNYQYPFGYIFGKNDYNGSTETLQKYYGSSTSNLTEDKYYIPTSLKKVTITGGGHILDNAFVNCSNLTSITIQNAESILHAFSGCNNLTSVTIGDGVKSIGDFAFDRCDNLTSVTISDGVKSIGDHAFKYCRSLTSITNAFFAEPIQTYTNVEGGFGIVGGRVVDTLWFAVPLEEPLEE